MSANDGFRLRIKAGVWYQDIGVSVGYKPVIGKNLGQLPMYKFYANRHFGEVLSANEYGIIISIKQLTLQRFA